MIFSSDHCVIPQLLLTTTSLTTTLQPANQVTPCSPSRPHYDIRQHSLFCDGTEERFAFHVPINYPSSYKVVEEKETDYAHLKQALTEPFPVVRNRSELETRFYASYQNSNQRPSEFVYELLKIHKHLKLDMVEEKCWIMLSVV
ncbi:uncharacterized protein TNCV_1378121 [Trichonephila clavipes]|nr:uncharacterized protein TNCV_1378121 [Trichonephila clavipes]